MRLRKVKYAADLIELHPEYVVAEPENYKGKWLTLFKTSQPIELEIGCGKGKFIYEKAKANPHSNFIGIEKYDSVIVRALEKLLEEPLDNLKLIRVDAETITDIFAEAEIAKLYLNFSDPWPKERHAKRRLTGSRFLERYRSILRADAVIELKTDNRDFYEFSLNSFEKNPNYVINRQSLDLYKDLPEDNIQTEFEQKFVAKGNVIYYAKVIFKRSSK